MAKQNESMQLVMNSVNRIDANDASEIVEQVVERINAAYNTADASSRSFLEAMALILWALDQKGLLDLNTLPAFDNYCDRANEN